jgi:hypothetical protein
MSDTLKVQIYRIYKCITGQNTSVSVLVFNFLCNPQTFLRVNDIFPCNYIKTNKVDAQQLKKHEIVCECNSVLLA